MTFLLEILAVFAGALVCLSAALGLAAYERARAFRRIQGDEVSCARSARRLRISMADRGRPNKRGASALPVAANAGGRKAQCA
ncbi:hypothetical protein [Rhizobium halophytocola]|uniref:Type II secretion system protein n=1 Tax=Rhizobium halophytocola TaxID=735519 RepID=A0ABS4DZW1_9HYPH|nr:hypothetical protein [Rhizobium halophytocola]MBP1851231.1 hypothetical protein [Rhizobium halophytocola]